VANYSHHFFLTLFYLYSSSSEMQKEVIEKIAALITAAFGVVAALAWNTAIQEIFRLIFGQQSGVLAMIAYAVIVTIIAVLVTIWIVRVAKNTQVKSQSAQQCQIHKYLSFSSK
jgi:ABC-type Mn2+/Zn2+ transport system permease subunit